MALKEENVFVFCAHSDDQIFGPGATLAKYASLGKGVYTTIFTHGLSSHPHLKESVVINMRIREAEDANRIINGKEVIFLGLNEGKIEEEFKEKKLKESIMKRLEEKKPFRIFTHSDEDPHPDHRAVCKVVLGLVDQLSYKPEVLAFDVWGFKIKTDQPKVFVDVSNDFHKKIEALKKFPSQWMSMITLLWSVYYKAIKDGFKCRCKYAEKFYKLR